MITQQDKDEFEGFCRAATNAQLRNIYQREVDARRKVFAAIAKYEMARRGLT
jgi:hypothetical protein